MTIEDLHLDYKMTAAPEEYDIGEDGKLYTVFTGDEFEKMSMAEKQARAERVWGPRWREKAEAEHASRRARAEAARRNYATADPAERRARAEAAFYA